MFSIYSCRVAELDICLPFDTRCWHKRFYPRHYPVFLQAQHACCCLTFVEERFFSWSSSTSKLGHPTLLEGVRARAVVICVPFFFFCGAEKTESGKRKEAKRKGENENRKKFKHVRAKQKRKIKKGEKKEAQRAYCSRSIKLAVIRNSSFEVHATFDDFS